jgi:hypothetical protein
MRAARLFLTASLLLAPAAPAAAAGKAGALLPGGRTVSGPGTLSIAMGGQVRVHSDSSASNDVCVTVVNTGSSLVTLTLTGALTPAMDINPGTSRALCVEDVQFVDVTCAGESSCSAQWRVDQN